MGNAKTRRERERERERAIACHTPYIGWHPSMDMGTILEKHGSQHKKKNKTKFDEYTFKLQAGEN